MRASGILLPVFSLPSRYGIGCFSKEAYTFAEQLARAGQRYWQILPLGPTGYGDSPYQSFSAFAGQWLLISPDLLAQEGLLHGEDIQNPPSFIYKGKDMGAVGTIPSNRSPILYTKRPNLCRTRFYYLVFYL